jgi:hypothetical protein
MEIEVEITEDLYVTFYGEVEEVDESFTHEFGTEKIKYNAIVQFTWDEDSYVHEDSLLIREWIEKNDVLKLLNDKL